MSHEFDITSDRYYMKLALDEAKIALEMGEVPVGAVMTYRGRLVAKARDQRQNLIDPTAHAVILALTQASDALQKTTLPNTVIYVTIEPSPMCMGALLESQVSRLVYGAANTIWGSAETVLNLANDIRLPHQIKSEGGIMEKDCHQLVEKYKAKQRSLWREAEVDEVDGPE